MRRYILAIALCFMVAAFAVAQTPDTYTPVEKEVPGFVGWIFGLLATKFGKVLLVPAALATSFSAFVALLQQGFALFGPKLKGKALFIVTAVLAALLQIGTVIADGQIEPIEWWSTLTALAAIVAAFFGYKLIYSAEARARVGK